MKKLIFVFCLVLISTVAKANTMSSIADVTLTTTATVIVPASGTTACAIITNNDAVIADRIGDQNCTTTRCARVVAGGSITLCTQGTIYGAAESGTPKVGVTLVNK